MVSLTSSTTKSNRSANRLTKQIPQINSDTLNSTSNTSKVLKSKVQKKEIITKKIMDDTETSYLTDKTVIQDFQTEEINALRQTTREQINLILNTNANLTFEIERGIFEASIIDHNDEYINYKQVPFITIYKNKLAFILNSLNISIIEGFLQYVQNGLINGYMIAFLTILQLNLLMKINYNDFLSLQTDPLHGNNHIEKLNCLTVAGKRSINRYEVNVDIQQRIDNVIKLIVFLGNISLSIKLEYGIIEQSILYVIDNKLDEVLIISIYNEKCNELFELLDKKSRLYSQELVEKIDTNFVDVQQVAFLSPSELNEGNWKEIRDKINYKNHVKTNHETTDLYKCPKCGERKATVMLMQTRGADEPITTFITCQHCGYVRKK